MTISKITNGYLLEVWEGPRKVINYYETLEGLLNGIIEAAGRLWPEPLEE